MEVTFCKLDPVVMRFRHDPLVGIGIFYLAIKSQMLNRCRAVKWSMVVQQPIVKFNKYPVYEYILIIYEHQFTNHVSQVRSNFSPNRWPKLGISKTFDAWLSEVNLMLIHSPQMCVSLKWSTSWDQERKNGFSGQCWMRKRLALEVFRCSLVVDSRLKTCAESILY